MHEKNITKIKRFDENGYFSLIYNRLALAEFSYLNTSEKIIYSVFARFSLEKSNFSEVDVFISENDTIIPLEEISYRKMASITGLSVGTCINSKKELSNKGFIIGKNIKINRKIVSNGYFKIPPYFKAKGESLNLYVYLKNKSYKYFGHIDTYRRKIAFETGKSVDDIHILLRKLYKLGLAERKGSIIYIR